MLLRSVGFGREELGNRKFDYIWAFQVFYHLEDDLVDSCLAEIKRRLNLEGKCFVNVNATTPPGRWKEFPFIKKELNFYTEMAIKHDLKPQVLGQLKDFGYTDKVPGYYHHMLCFSHG